MCGTKNNDNQNKLSQAKLIYHLVKINLLEQELNETLERIEFIYPI